MDFTAELARFTSDSTLPNWIVESVKGIVNEAQKSARLRSELHAATLKIQALTLELAHHRRMRFGAKSEALSIGQIDLFMETLESDRAELEARINAQTAPTPPKTKRSVAGRQALPEHLERIIHRHDPASCDCGQCGKTLVKVSEDITEQLDVEPARFFVHRHIRSQWACRHCETMTAEPIPAAIIDGGMATAGLLTWVAVSKFVDHLPLYRVEQIAGRAGVNLSRSTMAEWVGKIGVALDPLVERLIFYLKRRATWHADETPVQQLAPGKGKTKRAYLWVYRSNDLDEGPPIVVFDYQPGRGGKYAHQFLSGWQGHLMVDDYSGYKGLFRAGVTELACWAHARRKLFDLYVATKSPLAEQALKWIAALYMVETKGRDVDCAARQQLRQTESKAILTSFHAWMMQVRPTVAPGSSTLKALDYILRRWPALIRYAETGNLPIDNNPAENVIRPIAIGKKNWMFVGSERAGQRAAALQSLFATAKLNGLDPAAWLKMVLEKLPTCRDRDIDELLPFRRVA